MPDSWNPDQYARFRDERSRPFFNLMSLVQPSPGMRVVDLGCGSGELTQRLHRDLQASETLGIDNSEAMLSRSGEYAGDGLRFEQGDIATFDPAGRFDLIFSNAAFQWVPDNSALLARLSAGLPENGQLAGQVPANHDYPSHTVAAEIACEEPFLSALGGISGSARRGKPVLDPEEYAILLDRLGFREQHVRLQVYSHHLGSRDDVVEWVKGTLLTYYQQRLSSEMFEQFLERYRQRLLPLLDKSQPFFYPFKRILLWGRR